jgi:hypothetical protein
MVKKQGLKARRASLKNLNTNEDRQRAFWYILGALTVILIQLMLAAIN